MYESKMRLLETHSHTSEQVGYEARKNTKKAIEGKSKHYNKANHHQKTSRLPPAWRGGVTKKGTMIRQTTLKNLPRTASVAGGRDEASRLKGNAGALTRENNVKTLPLTTIVAGSETKRRKPARNRKVAQPIVPRSGEVPTIVEKA